MATGTITVTIHAKRRRTYWAVMLLLSACTLMGMSIDRAAMLAVKLGYRFTVDDQ